MTPVYRGILFGLLFVSWTETTLCAQVSNNQSLNGKYYFRYLSLTTDGTANITQVRGASGVMTFDGAGSYAATGQSLSAAAATQSLSVSGTYTVKPGGVVTISSPLQTPDINARLGASGLVGASTEGGASNYDLLIAIPAPTQPLTSSALSGTYWISTLEFAGGAAANLRGANFKLTANNAGSFIETAVTGQARNLGNRLLTQTVSPMTYSVSPDGTGTISFPLTGGLDINSQLVSGLKNISITQDGSYFIGGSNAAGGQGIIVGVKAYASAANWSGSFVTAGLRYDVAQGSTSARLTTAAGAVNATIRGSIWARRTRQNDGVFDASSLITYNLNADGSGSWTSTNGSVNVASTGKTFSSSGVHSADSSAYELYFGSQMIPQSGAGVFLNPQGVFNAASFAPAGFPISPGGFITLFGTGLASQPLTATSFPFPKTLDNVQVSVNGISAPIYSVTPTQISAVVPYSVSGKTATIVATVENVKSNSVDVPLAPTAPGIFTLGNNGLGDGAILHADFTVVNKANPSMPGETVLVFLTGLGAVSPGVQDGAAAPARAPLSTVAAPLNVYIGGLAATSIPFKGLAPGLAGLYQLNVTIPNNVGPGSQSIAVQTVDGFTDMANIWIGSPL
jgi:uncharacterized protein (TIGR03437 family)